jgi:hypothetical protein
VKRHLLVTVLAASALAACGGASSSSGTAQSATTTGTVSGAPTPTTAMPTTTAPLAAAFSKSAAKKTAEAELLRLPDLPTGWMASRSSDSGDGINDKAANQDLSTCLHVPASLLADSGPEQAEADSPDFTAPGKAQADFSETIDVTTESRATQAFSAVQEPQLPRCLSASATRVLHKHLAKQVAKSHLTLGRFVASPLKVAHVGQGAVGVTIRIPLTGKGLTISDYVGRSSSAVERPRSSWTPTTSAPR